MSKEKIDVRKVSAHERELLRKPVIAFEKRAKRILKSQNFSASFMKQPFEGGSQEFLHILDNLRVHQCKTIKESLRENMDIIVVFSLPVHILRN